MGEYQYYEFRAIDNLLSKEEREELRTYSTRGEITSASYVNTYHWGSFKGDPIQWMKKHFHMFLYVSHWGQRWLMIRLPNEFLSKNIVGLYSANNYFSFFESGSDTILSFKISENYDTLIEGNGWLDSLLPLREALFLGDYRVLYLGWLLRAQWGEIFDWELEPPLPPGLQQLDDPLWAFIKFFALDRDLVAAAANESVAAKKRPGCQEYLAWLKKAPSQMKEEALLDLILGEKGQFLRLRSAATKDLVDFSWLEKTTPRSARELGKQKLAAKKRRERKEEKEEKERVRLEQEERKKQLETFIGQEESLWEQVHTLVATRQPLAYDEAVEWLLSLRDIASMTNDLEGFQVQFENFYAHHCRRKKTFVKRLQESGLIEASSD